MDDIEADVVVHKKVVRPKAVRSKVHRSKTKQPKTEPPLLQRPSSARIVFTSFLRQVLIIINHLIVYLKKKDFR